MELKKKNNRSFGTWGEEAAIEYLSKNGFKILHRNFRAGKIGEIDIIAQEKDYLCFLEVKTRSRTDYGFPSESVDRKKQLNITRLASIYLTRHKFYDRNVRFDVVEIIADNHGESISVKSINLIRNAF